MTDNKDWYIYAAKLKHQEITYSSSATIVPVVVNACELNDEERKHLRETGHVFDDENFNISNLNPFFAELTSVYWLLHNTRQDYVGNAHYRRKWCDVDLEQLSNEALYVSDPLVFESSVAQQFLFCHENFDAPGMTIALAERQLIPFTPSEIKAVWEQRVLHPYQMARGPWKFYEQFMNVLFDCLWPIWYEYRDEIESLEGYNRRMMGFIGERMMTGIVLHKDKFFNFPISTARVIYQP